MPFTPATTDKFTKVGSPGTATTLSAPGFTNGVTVSINVAATTNWPTDTLVRFAMDTAQVVNGVESRIAGTYNEFSGIVTSATSIGSLTREYGTPQNYAAGSLSRVYIPVAATRENALVDGLGQDHNLKGNHKTLTDDNNNEWFERGQTASAVNQLKGTNAATGTDPELAASGDDSNIGLKLSPKGTSGVYNTKRFDGWTTGLPNPNTITNNGNRSYSLVFNGVDMTGYISPRMRLRFARTVAAPTQSTNLNGSNQYYSKVAPANMAQTDDITAMAWIKMAAYIDQSIGGRLDATAANGWQFAVDGTGRVYLIGRNAGAGNSRQVISTQSIPLNKWVHVAATLDMSGWTTATNKIFIDGIDVSASLISAGTNPTAFVAGTDFGVGRPGAFNGSYFNGKIAQFAAFSATLSQATVNSYMSQGLAGSETNIISAYSFNNSINDLVGGSANNLTANNGAVATNADSPFAQNGSGVPASGTSYEYGIVQTTSFSTNTTVVVQVPEGNMIPTSGGITSTDYSVATTPLNFPVAREKWTVEMIDAGNRRTQAAPVANTWYSLIAPLSIPIGSWKMLHNTNVRHTNPASTSGNSFSTVSTSNSAESDFYMTSQSGNLTVASATIGATHTKEKNLTLAGATLYYTIIRTTIASMSSIEIASDFQPTILKVENAYL